MNVEQRGITYRSNPEVYALGQTITFRTNFLEAARQMVAPEVHEIDVVITGTVGAVTGGALGRDAAKLIDTLKFIDAGGEVINASGAGLRVLEQLEVGSKQVDPADITSGSTNASYRYRLRVMLAAPRRMARARDTAVPLAHFLEGGELTITTPAAVPTGFAAVQSDMRMQIFAYLQDGRVRELKSRRRIREEAVTQQEFSYQVNGFLRAAILTSKLATTGHTDLSGYTTLNSQTLRWPAAFQTHNLVDDYLFNADAVATQDEFVRAATAALGIVLPERDQQIGRMIDVKTLHLDLLAAAPSGGRLLTDVIIDRDGTLAAITEGYASPGELAAGVRAHGRVVGASGDYPVAGFNAALARKLPIRIKPGRQ